MQLAGLHAGAGLDDSDARFDTQLQALELDRLARQRLQDLLSASGRLLERDTRQHDDEFVAADAAHEVTIARHRVEAPGDFDHDRVAGGVAEDIVDRLEPIKVDVDEARRRIRCETSAAGDRSSRSRPRRLRQSAR